MRRWGTVVAAALIGVSTSGCWLQVGGNGLKTGWNSFESGVTAANVGTLHLSWSKNLGSGGASFPLVNAGRVFVSSSPLMTAFDAGTGAILWQKDTTEGTYTPGLGDPALENGHVVTAYGIFSFGGTFSFDQATGTYTDSGVDQVFPYNAPAVDGSTVAMELGEVNSGGAATFISYGTHTGFINFQTIPEARPASNPMIAGDFVYATQGTTVFAFALDSCPSSPITGDCGPTWTADVGSNAGMPVSLSPTEVAVGLANGNAAVLDASTGALQWTAVTGSTNATAPAVTNTTMYVGTQDGSVRAFPAAGCGGATCSATWSGAAGAAIPMQPMVAGDVVYAGTAAGRVVAFPAAGCGGATCSTLFTATVDASATSVTPVVMGGQLYVTTNTGTVAAYRLP